MSVSLPFDSNDANRYITEIEQAHDLKLANNKVAKQLGCLFCYSEFVFASCLKYREVLEALITHLGTPTTARFDVSLQLDNTLDEITVKRRLRIHRHLILVLIAADDFLKSRAIKDTMWLLSSLADELYGVARRWAIGQLKPRFGQALNNKGEEVALIALGMGKLGGYELNFSSDIDLSLIHI